MRNLLLATTCACLLGLMAAACGGGSSQSDPPSQSASGGASSGPRLAWDQFAPSAEELRRYSFVLYVDGSPVPLTGATCGALAVGSQSAECTSPLPALAAGQHTLEMATRVTDNGVVIESARSAPITYTVGGSSVASVTEGARASGATAELVASGSRAASLRLPTVVTTSDGLAYAVDIVGAGVKGPAQLAWAPDGRLFVAEADGRVRVIRPGQREAGGRDGGAGGDGDGDNERGNLALDARILLDPPPAGPMGIALHPEFAQNHFVYVAILAQDDSRERAALRVIRLREVGGTLGEAATLFEAPLAVDAVNGEWDEGAGPRLAFGPHRLLHVALPPGAQFDREPAASTPHASMLRLRDDGRVPLDLQALEGVPSSPIGFDWHPTTGALWAVFPGGRGEALLRPLTASGASAGTEAGRVALPIATAGGGEAGSAQATSGVLRFERAPEGRGELARAFVGLPDLDALTVVKLAQPLRTERLLGGIFGPIGDIVTGDDGALYLAARSGATAAGAGGAGDGVVVRLSPKAR
ncbi:MAG: PQQ-dependent sugar dehydrogenase [Vicinamibacterales bacterium]